MLNLLEKNHFIKKIIVGLFFINTIGKKQNCYYGTYNFQTKSNIFFVMSFKIDNGILATRFWQCTGVF